MSKNERTTQYSKCFDLLIIYTSKDAHSALDTSYTQLAPFSPTGKNKLDNVCFAHLISTCKKSGITVAFSTSDDIVGSVFVKSFWTYGAGWARHNTLANSKIIFNRFLPKNKIDILTSSGSVYLFNKEILFNLLHSKIATYNLFEELSIPTVEIKNLTKEGVSSAREKLDKKLRNHKYSKDFNKDYVIKDNSGQCGQKQFRFNFGDGFELIRKQQKEDEREGEITKYLLQPFINCKDSFPFSGHKGIIDLRLIFKSGELFLGYIRIAKPDEFRCNMRRGGSLFKIEIETLPGDVLEAASKITKKLKSELDINHSIFALDFMKSNNGNLYFIEGGVDVGIDWAPDEIGEETCSKELIGAIVSELKLLIKERR